MEAAAALLGHVPSREARALSSGKSGTIAVIVPDIGHQGCPALVKGIYSELNAVRYTQLLLETEGNSRLEATVLEQVRKSTDGVIIAASALSDNDLRAAASRRPVVAVGWDMPGVPSVVAGPAPALYGALAHLARKEHTHVAYARSSGPLGWDSRTESRAVQDAAAARGLELTFLGPFLPTVDSGPAAITEVLGTMATVCVASSSLLALGMLERCKQMELSVPGRLSLIGCDDSMGATFCSPSLTTLSSPLGDVGAAAARMLSAILAGSCGSAGTDRPVVVPAVLKLRASTAT